MKIFIRNALTVLLIALPAIIIISIFYILKGTSDPSDSRKSEEPKYYLGVSGYIPPNFPKQSIADIQKYWETLPSYANLYGIHVNWKDKDTISNLSNATQQPKEILLGYQDPSDWIGKKDDLKKQIDLIIKDHSNIKYLGIGNEINIIQLSEDHDISELYTVLDEMTQYVKRKNKDIKVFTTIQYDALRGDGYLMGDSDKRSFNLKLVHEVEKHVDFVAFTVFPYFDYKDPKDIPSSYLTDLALYTDKSFAITETAWPTRKQFGGKLKTLTEQGYSWSENEQLEYMKILKSFIEKSSTYIEFVNWLYMNDITDWKDGDSPTSNELFETVGFRYNNGEEKKGSSFWYRWVNNL